MVGEYFLSLLFQLLFTIGAVALFGFASYFVNKTFYRIVGGGTAVCYATGVIGTPVHEASHALMCLVFRHKILEIKFFQIDPDSGVLGYVRHSYDYRNFYQRLGNFFIGVAPVLVGNAIILLMMFFLARDAWGGVTEAIGAVAQAEGAAAAAGAAFAAAGKSFIAVFMPANFANGWWYLFIVVALCIALHVNLSPADVSGSVSGAVMLVLLFAVVDVVLAIITSLTNADALGGFTGGVVTGGAVMMCVMALSLALSLALLAVAGLIRLIVYAVRRR